MDAPARSTAQPQNEKASVARLKVLETIVFTAGTGVSRKPAAQRSASQAGGSSARSSELIKDRQERRE